MRQSNENITTYSSGSAILGSLIPQVGFPSNTSSTSSILWTNQVIRQSFQGSISSGTIWGTFQVQVSNDLAQGTPPNQFTPSNWSTLGTQSYTAVALTGPNTFLIPSFETNYEYTRVQFVCSSLLGSGIYNIRVEQKAL